MKNWKKNADHIYKHLAIFISVLSLASLIQNIFYTGLKSVFFEIISYYRFIPVSIFQIMNLNVSKILMDLWVLSFIGAGAYVRTPNIECSRFLRCFNTKRFIKHWRSLYFLILGISLVGCGILLTMLSPFSYIDSMNDEPSTLLKGAVKNVILIIFVLLWFFAINAYAKFIFVS